MNHRILVLFLTSFLSFAANAEFIPFSAVLIESAPLNATAEITKPSFLPCAPAAGESVMVLAQASHAGLPQFLSKVEVKSGQCQGTVGWVVTSRLKVVSN